MKRLIVLLLSCALLCGCATKPNGDLDSSNCVPPSGGGGGGGNPLVDIAAVLLVDLIWFGSCEAVVGITNGIHHFQLAHSHDGVYSSPDGAFSVAVPLAVSNEYRGQEQSSAGKDTVVFVPRTPGEPIYGITVLPRLEGPQAEMSLADFSSQARADLLGIGVPVTQVHAEDTQLGANAARLVVYRAQARDGAGQPDYYLMYFVKTTHTAAIISITWPYDCPYCNTGSDAAIRSMDPTLGSFLDSFELTSKTP